MSLHPSRYNLFSYIIENKQKLQKALVFYLFQNIYTICTAGWESNPCGDIKENIYFSVR